MAPADGRHGAPAARKRKGLGLTGPPPTVEVVVTAHLKGRRDGNLAFGGAGSVRGLFAHACRAEYGDIRVAQLRLMRPQRRKRASLSGMRGGCLEDSADLNCPLHGLRNGVGGIGLL